MKSADDPGAKWGGAKAQPIPASKVRLWPDDSEVTRFPGPKESVVDRLRRERKDRTGSAHGGGAGRQGRCAVCHGLIIVGDKQCRGCGASAWR